MIVAEVLASHMPMKVLCLQIEGEAIGQQVTQLARYLLHCRVIQLPNALKRGRFLVLRFHLLCCCHHRLLIVIVRSGESGSLRDVTFDMMHVGMNYALNFRQSARDGVTLAQD